MFKVSKNRIVKKWPAVIPVPQDGGRVMKYDVEVDLEVLTQPEQDAIYTGSGTDVDLLQRVVVGWEDGQFQDHDEKPLSCNEQTKAVLFAISYVRAALIEAYLKAYNGREGQRKN
jgi:hypothetical protein